MRTQGYIRQWDLRELTAKGDATCAKKESQARLKLVQPEAILPGRGWGYPTTGENYIRTTEFSPTLRTEWSFIEVDGSTPQERAGTADTGYLARVYSDGSSYFWDGANWAPAGASDWNSLEDFNLNLKDWAATLAVEVKLTTTNANLSPTIRCLRLRWEGRVSSPLREWLYQGVVASLESNVRPLTDYVVPGNGTATLDLSSFDLYNEWDLKGVVEAYNDTSDPAHATDILASYVGTTITLTEMPAASDDVWLVLEYSPQIAVTTDSDFTEQAKAPAILITSVNTPTNLLRAYGTNGPAVIDKTLPLPAGTVFVDPIPMVDIDFTIATVAPTSLDLLKLNGALSDWLLSHPTLSCSSYDQSVRCHPGLDLEWATDTANVGDPRQAAGAFRLRDVPWYSDRRTGAATDASSVPGPIDAGDPDAPGVGFGVSVVKVGATVAGGTGSTTINIKKL